MFGVKEKIKWLSSNTTADLENQFDEFFKTIAGVTDVIPLVEKEVRITKYMLIVRYIPQ